MNRLLKKLRRAFQNHKNIQSISSNRLMVEVLEPRVLLSSGTEMVSISSLGIQGNDHSAGTSINADGRYISFSSDASNLVADDTNGVGDVFVYDRELAVIERVSISSTGIQANNDSLLSSISADGRYIAFGSDASNLVADDTNGVGDIFVYDRELDVTKRVSISSTGLQANGISSCPTISANGQYVAFCSEASNLVADDTNEVGDVFVYDLELAIIERVNISSTGIQANSDSFFSSISADGRCIAFGSDASNLVPNDTSGNYDIFVYDRFLDSVEIVSISSNGTNGNSDSNYPSISADGRYVAFDSEACNLVEGDTNGEQDIFVYDRELDSVERVSISLSGIQANGYSTFPSISADGRCVAFVSCASNLVSGDTNYEFDVFVYDRELDVTKRVSISSTGLQANSTSWMTAINADGQYVAFDSEASNLVEGDTNGVLDIFVFDLDIDKIERVSISPLGTQGNDDSGWPSISSDGRYVAFDSNASNLVPDDTNEASDIFVYDRELDMLERISVSSSGKQGNWMSNCPSINADGRYVAFASKASNLVLDDFNGVSDVFVYDRELAVIERVSISSTGIQANSDSWLSSISADGRYVAFESAASNLINGDTNYEPDIFVYDRELDITKRVSISSTGLQANGISSCPTISANGQYVAFCSEASNLVADDTNGVGDVFVYDCELDKIECVSISSSGVQSNDRSNWPSISGDGRYVAFDSKASNLVPNDINDTYDIFVYDRFLDSIELVSISSNGTHGNYPSTNPSISADGRCVAFVSLASNLISGGANYEYEWDIFVYDRELDVTKRVSISSTGLQANGISSWPAISSDGQYVAFDSEASNLVEGDTNGNADVYVANTNIEIALPIEVTLGGASGNTVSFRDADGSNVRVLSIGGQAVVMFAGTNLSETAIYGIPTVIGDNIEIKSIDTICQGNPGMLMITSTGGDGRADLGEINGESLSMIIAQNVNLWGDITMTGSLGMMMVGDIADTVTITTGQSGNGLMVIAGDVGADFDIAGPVNMFMCDSFTSGSLTADKIAMVMPRTGDLDADLTARNGDIGTVIASGAITGQLLASGNINMLMSQRGGLTGTVRAGNNIGMLMVNADVSGRVSANHNINMLLALGGDITGSVRAGTEIGVLMADNLDNALLSAGGNIRMISIRRDIIDSYILGGYDVGTDCAFDIQESGGGDLLNNGNIGLVMAGGSFKRSYIGAGILPSGTLTSSLPNVGIPATGVGGNIRLITFGSIDTNAQDDYGVFYSMSRGSVLIGGRLVDDTLDDYFRVKMVS